MFLYDLTTDFTLYFLINVFGILGFELFKANKTEFARASLSPTFTKWPYFPLLRISLGPLGQSVLTTFKPNASASIITVGSPSLFMGHLLDFVLVEYNALWFIQ